MRRRAYPLRSRPVTFDHAFDSPPAPESRPPPVDDPTRECPRTSARGRCDVSREVPGESRAHAVTTRLLLAAGAGDRRALAGLVRRTQAEVWRFCASLVDADAAHDLTQETYVRALGAARAFRGDASARTWLLAIARRVCSDEIRSRQRRRWLRDDDRLDPQAGPAAPDPTGRFDVEQLIAALDPDRRAAFVLTQQLGLTYAEAAAACEVPVGTIRSRVARAREQLVEMLADDPGAGAGRAWA